MFTDKEKVLLVNLKIWNRNGQRFWYQIGKNTLNFFSNFSPTKKLLLKVPLQKNLCFGFTDELSFQSQEKSFLNFKLREVLEIIELPQDQNFAKFIQQAEKIYQLPTEHLWTTYLDLLNKCAKIPKKTILNKPVQLTFESKIAAKKDLILTDEQKIAIEKISEQIGKNIFAPSLLFGVTGSGKTEVYKNLILHAAAQNRSSILLLPEIGLCDFFFNKLKILENFGISVLRYHSAATLAEAHSVLNLLNSEQPTLLLGVHLPIFLPLKNLGLIIVDEEHETGFARQNPPRIDSKQMALLRAKNSDIPIVLGSATPTVSSFFAAQTAPWQIFQLTKKISLSERFVETALLTTKERRSNFWLTKKLEAALELRLEKGEQSIIFINRRGHSFYTQCKKCGFVLECKNCSVSLTVHLKGSQTLAKCHYCTVQQPCPNACPDCKQPDSFTFKGIGTQKVCEILEKRFPAARVARVDLDSAQDKKSWPEKIKAILAGNFDIIVGTQSVTKGYHFPNVTLVGVIWADLDFNFPSYNAKEIALQRLLQIAGRTGRGEKPGQIILQVMKDAKIFQEINENKYANFLTEELKIRENVQFPPFKKFYQIQVQHQKESVAMEDAELIAEHISKLAQQQELAIEVLGPFSPPVDKICKTYIQELILKSDSLAQICGLIGNIDFTQLSSKANFRPLF